MAAVLLALIVLLGAHPASGEEPVIRDLKNTKVIRSQESPHNILNEACIACHPKEKFDFWLLIYKGKPPTMAVDRPTDPGAAQAPTGSARPKNRYNSHDSLTCNLCHFGNPTEAAPNFLVDIRELCRLCHPGAVLHRLPEGEDQERIIRAIDSKSLPGAEGKFLCTTCHKIHDSTYGIREAYVQILWKDRIPNPHRDRSLCSACHPGRIREGTEIRFTGGRDNIRLCNECHEKPGVPKTPHIVNATSSEATWRMDYLGFPLVQGKLVCSTCHDEAAHGRHDQANPKFLRGGPYNNSEEFCYKCHLEDRDRLNNPHSQIDPFGRIREESCRFCHRNAPRPESDWPGNFEMVGDETIICSNCHQRRPHPMVDHIVRLKPEMSQRKTDYETRHQVALPLDKEGTIKCSTCHNPHTKGVLKGKAGVGGGSKWRVPDFREMCAPCHGRY